MYRVTPSPEGSPKNKKRNTQMKRKKMSKRSSRGSYRKGHGVKAKNTQSSPMRGGIRL